MRDRLADPEKLGTARLAQEKRDILSVFSEEAGEALRKVGRSSRQGTPAANGADPPSGEEILGIEADGGATAPEEDPALPDDQAAAAPPQKAPVFAVIFKSGSSAMYELLDAVFVLGGGKGDAVNALETFHDALCCDCEIVVLKRKLLEKYGQVEKKDLMKRGAWIKRWRQKPAWLEMEKCLRKYGLDGEWKRDFPPFVDLALMAARRENREVLMETAVLRAIKVPSLGGNTCFANMAAIHAELPEHIQRKINRRQIQFDVLFDGVGRRLDGVEASGTDIQL